MKAKQAVEAERFCSNKTIKGCKQPLKLKIQNQEARKLLNQKEKQLVLTSAIGLSGRPQICFNINFYTKILDHFDNLVWKIDCETTKVIF